MKHARPDYDRIQDPAGLIPADEPVLLIRGQDVCAPEALRAYADIASENGVEQDLINRVLDQAKRMETWQHLHGRKVPDLPRTLS